MKRETLLWTQGINNMGLFSLDSGVVAPGNPVYSELLASFSLLVHTDKWDYRDDLVRIFFDGTTIIITGYFKETDDTGRKVTYTLYHPSKEPQTAISELKSLSEAIHYTLPAGVVDKISTSLQSKATKMKNTRRMLWISSIALFVLLLTILVSK